MPFLKCNNCIVKSCCGEVCQDFKEYIKKKSNITIGNNISLKEVERALGNIREVEHNILWNLSKVDNDKVSITHKQGRKNDKK